MKTKQEQIHKLATDIMWEIDGLLKGDKIEKTLFRKAKKIARLSEEMKKYKLN